MNQPTLFTDDPKPLSFGGKVDPVLDVPRLTRHLERVKEIMSDGRWRTLRELADLVGCSEASASARLRDLRRHWAGGHTVDKKRVKESGLWLYKMK